MNNEMRKIGGVWMPAREEHMISFLTDPKTTVDGVGTYQLHKINRVLKEMRDRGMRMHRALDVGSHVGTWSRFLARNFAVVECFEPHPVHRECFVKNMREWGTDNVRLHAVAVGSEARLTRLMTNPHSSGDSWLDDGHPHDGYEAVADVEVIVLDDYCWARNIDEIDLIKIDCEGGELAVLKGADRILREHRPFVCVEQKPGRAEKYGLPRTAACDYLESLGAKRVAEMSGDYMYAFERASI